MKNKKLVIIPTYNEIENIENIIKAVLELVSHFDILIVDDGSPDGTAEVVKAMQKTYKNRIHLLERSKKQGLGTAYIRGFKYAIEHCYDYIFEMDADFSHNPKDVERLYYACAVENNDLAIGSRYVNGVNVVNWPISRVLLSFFASMYVRFITGIPIHDTTSGFKCYNTRVFKYLDLDKIRFIGYAFQIEMKFKLWKHGFKIKEVPIIFTDRTKGYSKMSKNIFQEAILGVLEMKITSLFKKYRPVENANQIESHESVEFVK